MKISKQAKELVSHIDLWLKVYIPKTCGYSVQTVMSYKQVMRLYVEYLEEKKSVTVDSFSDICFSRETVESWLIWLQNGRGGKPCSRRTRDHRLTVIRSLLKYLQSRDIAYAKRYIESCEIPMISHGRGKVVAPLSKVAMKAFFASIDCNTIAGKRDYALFSFMYDTGCRVGEVLSIKTCDLILDHGSPYVIVKGKGNKDRCLILSEKTVNTLKAYIAYFSIPYDAKTYLFHSSHKGRTEKMSADAVNTRLYAISYTAHKTCPEIPLKMHSHQIRHSAATHWFMDGINIAMISEYLGHASLETTRVYLGISREELETALRKREYMPLDQPKKYKIQGGLRGLLGL